MENTLSAATLASLGRQLRALASAPPPGVRWIPSEQLTEVMADIDGPPGTPYDGGSFRVKLLLGRDYPAAPPKGTFLTKIFHPNVSSTGEICVNTLKRDWTPDTSLGHVLAVVRCLLIVPFPESSLNDEAGKLFMESYDDYCKKARLITQVHAARAPGVNAAPTAGAGASSSATVTAGSSAAAVTKVAPAAASGRSDESSALASATASSATSAALLPPLLDGCSAASSSSAGIIDAKAGKALAPSGAMTASTAVLALAVAPPSVAAFAASDKRPRNASVTSVATTAAAVSAAAVGAKKKASMKRL